MPLNVTNSRNITVSYEGKALTADYGANQETAVRITRSCDRVYLLELFQDEIFCIYLEAGHLFLFYVGQNGSNTTLLVPAEDDFLERMTLCKSTSCICIYGYKQKSSVFPDWTLSIQDDGTLSCSQNIVSKKINRS